MALLAWRSSGGPARCCETPATRRDRRGDTTPARDVGRIASRRGRAPAWPNGPTSSASPRGWRQPRVGCRCGRRWRAWRSSRPHYRSRSPTMQLPGAHSPASSARRRGIVPGAAHSREITRQPCRLQVPARCEDGVSCPRCPQRRENSVSFPQYAETISNWNSVGIVGIVGKIVVSLEKKGVFRCPRFSARCPRFLGSEAFALHVGAQT